MSESREHVGEKPRLSRDSLDTSTVQVIVGQSKKAFTVHKGVLCNVAPFFRAAFEGQLLEGIEQVLGLPEDDETLFRHFQLWVYTKHVLEDGEGPETVNWKTLVDLHVFGDKYGIPDLQNAAIDILIDKQVASNKVPTGLFDHVYQNTRETSPLRKLFVNWTVWGIDPKSWFEGNRKENYPRDFLIDLATANYELKRLMRPKKMDFGSKRSDYHVKSL